MAKLSMLGLKIVINKPKPKRIASGVVKVGTIRQGVVIKDVDDIYKVAIELNDSEEIPSRLVVPFTSRSYDIEGRDKVFSRDNPKLCIIRDKWHCKFSPGLPEQFIPFAPNWIVRGYLVRNAEGTLMFDFTKAITINGYNADVKHPELD